MNTVEAYRYCKEVTESWQQGDESIPDFMSLTNFRKWIREGRVDGFQAGSKDNPKGYRYSFTEDQLLTWLSGYWLSQTRGDRVGPNAI